MTPYEFVNSFAPPCFTLLTYGRGIREFIYDLFPDGHKYLEGDEADDPLADNDDWQFSWDDESSRGAVQMDEEYAELLTRFSQHFGMALHGIGGYGYGQRDNPYLFFGTELSAEEIDPFIGTPFEWGKCEFQKWRYYYELSILSLYSICECSGDKYPRELPVTHLRNATVSLWRAENGFREDFQRYGSASIGPFAMIILEDIWSQRYYTLVLEELEFLSEVLAVRQSAAPKSDSPPRHYTTIDLARQFNVPEATIRAWIERGELGAINARTRRSSGPLWRISADSVKQFRQRRDNRKGRTDDK